MFRCLIYLSNLSCLCIFSCKTLVVLKLSKGITIPVSSTVCLPNVKKIQLLDVNYEANESLPCLISGCSVLEELTIQRSDFDKMFYCNISSHTVVHLTLLFLYKPPETFNQIHCYVLHINTPALQYLHLRDRLSREVSAGILPSLIEADICLWTDLYRESVYKFIERLNQVRRLRFSRNFDEDVYEAPPLALKMKFPNLIKLGLEADYILLAKLLENTDNLEILVIRKVAADRRNLERPRHVPLCLISCLRKITIHGFCNDFKMLEYFLHNAKVLRRIKIYSIIDGSEKKFDAVRSFLKDHKIPETCKVDFH